MISTELYKGQGLGNQLWCYAVTRVIALDRGYDFGIEHAENFKGVGFMELDFGKTIQGITEHYDEKESRHPLNGADIRLYDSSLVNVPDNTKIDGIMQDERYIAHRKDEVREWLSIKPGHECLDYAADDVCIMNFRGDGYVNDSSLFLSKRYWRDAMKNMRKISEGLRFVVVTDDVATARTFFPDLEVHHWDIGKDYAVIASAHYLILSNSSFAWFPAWLSKDLKYCIAPKYWARHNVSDGFWCPGYALTSGWMYQDRLGNLSSYEDCLEEAHRFEENNGSMYRARKSFEPSLRTYMKEKTRIWHTLRKESSILWAIRNMVGMAFRRTAVRMKKLIAGEYVRFS